MGGSSGPPQNPIYASAPYQANPPGFSTEYGGGHTGSTLTSGGGLLFGAPGEGLQQMGHPAPGQGGKGMSGGDWVNQTGSGTQGPQTPNYDPALGMNQVYAPWNQLPGTMTSGSAPDFGMSTTQPSMLDANKQPIDMGLLNQVFANPSTPTMSGFGTSPYFLGNYGYLGQGNSPYGISPYWSSPFVSAAQSGGKGVA